MAATLACGDEAVVSHRSAAQIWGLMPLRDLLPVEVSVPSSAGRKKRDAVRIYRRSSLLPAWTTRHRGIPVTTPRRTFADLRPMVSASQLRRVGRQAAALGLAIGSIDGDDGTRSELEFRFLHLCRRYRLPAPAVNVRLNGPIVDFLWEKKRLVVETDGYQFHRGRLAFEDDRERDLKLRAAGYDVIRLSYRQVVDQPRAAAAVLKRALDL